jgi:aminoacrylate hydrolase
MPLTHGLYYEEHGPAGARPIVLSSGLGGSGSYWLPNLTTLSERYRVILYDHRGTGRSDRDVPGDLTLEAVGQDIGLLLKALDISKATLVGHAIGGMAGLALALTDSEQLERLVVINGWAKLDPHTERCFDTRLALLRDSGPRAYVHAQPLFLYPAQWISDHHGQLQDEEEVHLGHLPTSEMIERRIAAARRFDIVARLKQIAVPTLLVVSEDDMLVPSACSDALVGGITGAQIARMNTGGHACNITRPDDFTKLLLNWFDGKEE